MDECYRCLQVQKNCISLLHSNEREGEGGEGEKETDMKLEKTFKSP